MKWDDMSDTVLWNDSKARLGEPENRLYVKVQAD